VTRITSKRLTLFVGLPDYPLGGHILQHSAYNSTIEQSTLVMNGHDYCHVTTFWNPIGTANCLSAQWK